MTRPFSKLVFIAACLAVAGCAGHYTTPHGGTNFAELASPDVQSYYLRKPASPFPANVAIVRVQDYGYGKGRYRTITELAEAFNHHPELITEWGRTTVKWWSHKIRGLHELDFAMAKRCDALG